MCLATFTTMDLRGRDVGELLQERRDLLEHVLRAYAAKGARIVLPIGMSTPEAWLLDSVSVKPLLAALQPGKANQTQLPSCWLPGCCTLGTHHRQLPMLP